MIFTEEDIFKVLALTNLSSMNEAAEQQAQDLTDIINENFSVETSEKIISMMVSDGLLDRVYIKTGDIFG